MPFSLCYLPASQPNNNNNNDNFAEIHLNDANHSFASMQLNCLLQTINDKLLFLANVSL